MLGLVVRPEHDSDAPTEVASSDEGNGDEEPRQQAVPTDPLAPEDDFD